LLHLDERIEKNFLWTPVDGCVKARSHRSAYGIW